MDNPLMPICEIFVSDGGKPKVTNVLPTNDGVAWCFLAKLDTSLYAYNFNTMQFQSITPIEYTNLLKNCHSVELVTNQNKNTWTEIPITAPHPARKIFDSVIPRSQSRLEQKSNHRVSKSEHEALANLNLSSDGALETYARTEKLLSDLIKDDY